MKETSSGKTQVIPFDEWAAKMGFSEPKLLELPDKDKIERIMKRARGE